MLLETVGQTAYQNTQPDPSGFADQGGGGLRSLQQRVVAQFKVTWNQCSNGIEIPETTRPVLTSGRLDCISLWLMNRPVRSRMQGGVGAGS